MVKAKVDQSEVFDRAINGVLQDTYRQVITEENLKPFARPAVDVTKLSDTELELKFTLILAPEVKLGDYKGLHAEKQKAEVNDDEVEHAIEHLVNDNASLIVKDSEALLGDTVVMDFEGSVDGKPFDGGKSENYSLELGSKQFIPGFEDQLVGVKAGDKKDVNVKFPNEYAAELAGKEATFKIKVHEVKVKKIPELNEELIKDLNLPNVKTVEDLKAHEKNRLLTQKDEEVQRHYFEDLMKQIRDNATIEIAKEIIDGEVEAMEENLRQQVEQKGLTLDKYLEITGQSLDKMHEQMRQEADVNIRSVLVLEKIAELENIVVADEEIEFELAKIADQYHMPIDEVKKVLKDRMDDFKVDVRSRRIREFIVHNNN